ncbi:MAG: hypothetical protein RMN24_00745 [Anaerolineae bacterium]|nr:hypothetical protein [Caldilineales bacterium]MDW8267667.1 hypothetical protein [Anaerolineae bacterium]
MPTYVVYTQAGSSTPSWDSYPLRHVAAGESWTTIHSATTGTHEYSTQSFLQMRIQSHDTATNMFVGIYRVMMNFDTSSIPTHEIVTSVSLSLYGDNILENFGNGRPLQITAHTFTATPPTLAAYNRTYYGSTVFGTAPTLTTASWNTYTLDTGIVVPGNITRVAIRDKRDYDNTPPTWVAGKITRYQYISADAGWATPYLTVTTVVPLASQVILL